MYTNKILKIFLTFVIVISTYAICCADKSKNVEDFTIGIYGVDSPQDIKIVKDAGFNTIHTYKKDLKTIKTLAKEAKKQDVSLVVFPDKLTDITVRKEAVDLPVKAWYIYDEPERKNVSPAMLKMTDEKIRQKLPGPKIAFATTGDKTKFNYYGISDIMMIDHYPVPYLPLESFGEKIYFARKELNKAKNNVAQLWAIVQMFDWSEDMKLYEGKDIKPRFPSKEEIRFMSYDAIFNGATGLFYFTFRSQGDTLAIKRPKQWQYITEIIDEIKFSAKIFSYGRPVCTPLCNGKNFKCDVCEDGIFNITGNESFLKIKTFEYDEALYTFIINPVSINQTIPKIFFDQKFDLLFEKETNPSKVLNKTKNNCKPYAVYIFRHN